MNDCAEGDDAELRAIARLTGPVDVLLTQFSYAAWKGGRSNAHFRKVAAARKLEVIAAQVLALKPRHVVPFASFVYFQRGELLSQRPHQPARRCRRGDSCRGGRAADPLSGRELRGYAA